jgi:hypothetical protein
MAASLRKKMELARRAFSTTLVSESEPASNSRVDHSLSETQNPDINADDPSITALLEPALAIIGHEHKIYYAYPSSTTGDITILGPDEKFTNLSTRSVQGIFKIHKLLCYHLGLWISGRNGEWARTGGRILGRLFGEGYERNWQRHLPIR